MAKRRIQTPPEVRRRALALLSSGKVSLPELASVLGVSTQVLWNWCRQDGVDWRKARMSVVAKEWSKVNR